ncbi:LytTR family DNA-binding domain-containing protein [Companilactobacillus musae]|uniref:LytTR family DNA-binding domain-containing protein n=1 Tax=Companilactobacillus musae TaxID=1903258 RepID=UPI0013C35958|nr:LytTR family DNA-binding domain-containing protein [Companilactobacillus musae]
MKVKLELDSKYSETEVVVKAAQKNAEVIEILNKLNGMKNQFNHLNGYLGETVYTLELKDILFFETNDRNVYAHTANNAFLIHYRLYELEKNLPDNFLRISKSSILNVDEILSLSRSVTGNLVKFKNTYKQIYVSRRFWKALKNKLDQRKL